MKIKGIGGTVALLALFAGCAAPPSESKYVVDTPTGQVDTRVSTNGYTRPTLANQTVTVPVHYYNPNTGTESDYDCEVDLDSDGKVERVNWPTSGWTEGEDVNDNHDGTQTLIDERGYEYTVDLSGETSDEDADRSSSDEQDSDSADESE